MSERKARNAIIRCIQHIVTPKLRPSGYMDSTEPGGRLLVWCPENSKAFGRNTVITCVKALGRDWISDDGDGHGLCTTAMKDIPLADLANILEWLLDEQLKGTK